MDHSLVLDRVEKSEKVRELTQSHSAPGVRSLNDGTVGHGMECSPRGLWSQGGQQMLALFIARYSSHQRRCQSVVIRAVKSRGMWPFVSGLSEPFKQILSLSLFLFVFPFTRDNPQRSPLLTLDSLAFPFCIPTLPCVSVSMTNS